MSGPAPYLLAIAFSFGVSALLCPLVRSLALRYGWVDHPSTPIKTHAAATPVLGGVAIFSSYAITLFLLRFLTHFPSGTLHALRGILLGGALVFALGVADDMRKPGGLGFRLKFAVQIAAAASLLLFGLRIRFITPVPVAVVLTVIWVVGVTNAFNIIDVMDGLSASQAAVASLAFLMIALPREQRYVNFASAALAGAALGYLPWNFSSRRKIFMGDSGSLFLGYALAAVSLGTDYSAVNRVGVYAPLMILLVPIFDTLFVAALRLRKGRSPFLGSKDHFALRLETAGWSRGAIVLFATLASLALGFCGFLLTALDVPGALAVGACVAAGAFAIAEFLWHIPVHD
jgi:UDP-GlcNAc:undecaprenyl-phosphate GlcNAc-1-phosphate transferase